MPHAELVEKPVVQRPVILELETADRVGHVLDGIALPVGPVVGRVDAPLVARAVVSCAKNPVHHRIAHVEIGVGHIDFGPQDERTVGKLAGLHPSEQVEVLLNRPVAVGAVSPGRSPAILGDLLPGE